MASKLPVIYHITSESAWLSAEANGAYAAPSLATEGFIHCSYADQVTGVANRFYAGQRALLLLVIDQSKLATPAIVEDSYGHGSFPHIYSTLPVTAVVRTVPIAPQDDGVFDLTAIVAGD